MYKNLQYSKNILNESVFDFDWTDNQGKEHHTQLTLRELINKYVELKNKLDKTNLILRQINTYRQTYKEQRDKVQKQLEYERNYTDK